MADQRDDNLNSEQEGSSATDRPRQQSEFAERRDPTMDNQGAEGSFGGDSSGSHSGSAGANGSTIAGRGNARAGSGRPDDSTSGQPIGGNDSATGTGTTLTQGADFGQGTTSTAGGSSVGTDQTSGGSSGVSGGEGFVGSQSDDSGDYLQDNQPGSSAAATGGTDFAEQGRGAAEDNDQEGAGGSGTGDAV
jgi:hypothetical protein